MRIIFLAFFCARVYEFLQNQRLLPQLCKNSTDESECSDVNVFGSIWEGKNFQKKWRRILKFH